MHIFLKCFAPGMCLISTFCLPLSAQVDPCADIRSVQCRQKVANLAQESLKKQFPNISVNAIEDVLVFSDPSAFKDRADRVSFHGAMDSTIKTNLCQVGFNGIRIQPKPNAGEEYGLGCERTTDHVPTHTTEDRPTEASDQQALSKDYRKAAITAMASISDWQDKAKAVFDSMNYSSGSVYVNRRTADRAADAAQKSVLDVKLAKADASTRADKDFQKRIEIYLDAVKVFTKAQVNLDSGLITKDVSSKVSGCKFVLEKALDKGSTKVFAEHADRCKPEDSD